MIVCGIKKENNETSQKGEKTERINIMRYHKIDLTSLRYVMYFSNLKLD